MQGGPTYWCFDVRMRVWELWEVARDVGWMRLVLPSCQGFRSHWLVCYRCCNWKQKFSYGSFCPVAISPVEQGNNPVVLLTLGEPIEYLCFSKENYEKQPCGQDCITETTM